MLSHKPNSKGFTLAELLIVVAIIGVLVAISIPVFTSQLERSREATDIANIRAAYAEACVEKLSSAVAIASIHTVEMTQQKARWDYVDPIIGSNYYVTSDGTATGTPILPTKGDIIIVSIDDDITISFASDNND